MSERPMRVGLVGCVKSKASQALRARDMYTSPLFRGRRSFVARSCDRWFILSAKHELLDPDQVIEPYNLELKDLSGPQRQLWSQRVLYQLERGLGDLGDYEFEVHAGAEYLNNGLIAGLRARGANVINPSSGRSLGRLLSFYNLQSMQDGVRGRERAPGQVASTANTGFTALARWLELQPDTTVVMSFEQIGLLIGRSLPASASSHRAYWANSHANARAQTWLSAGWRVESVDGRAHRVGFRRSI